MFLKAALKHSGLEAFGAHQCRHTVAFRRIWNGGRLSALQLVLGDAPITPPAGSLAGGLSPAQFGEAPTWVCERSECDLCRSTRRYTVRCTPRACAILYASNPLRPRSSDG